MKKIIYQISLILFVIIMALDSVLITNVYAADSMAGINCVTSVEKGKDFTVSLIIPEANAFGIQADINVKFSDGTSETKTIIFMGEYGDKSVTFNAKVAGKTTVTAKNIIITDENTNVLEQGKTKNHELTIIEKNVEKPATPSVNTNNTTINNIVNNITNTSTTQTTPPATTTTNTTTTNNTTNNQTIAEPKFKEVNETVYTTEQCNIRKSYSTSSEKIATVNKGTELIRKGIGDNDWSKVEYKGKEVYIYSKYLTTKAPVEEEVIFKDTNENLYAKQNCNLRKSWSTESDKVGYLLKGDSVVRTGYADNGWSRINYNGQTVYVASRLLVVEKPENEEKNEINNENIIDTNIVENEPVQELTEEQKLNIIKEEVGVLPEVGNNIANVMYLTITILAIVGVIAAICYIKKR